MTIFTIIIFSLAILHCIYLLCKLSLNTKKKTSKNKILKYYCPSCGSDIEILKRTDYNMYFSCSNPHCFNYRWGSADINFMNNHAQVIQERVPNPDNIKDWDIANAKDAEIVSYEESFKRKKDLD